MKTSLLQRYGLSTRVMALWMLAAVLYGFYLGGHNPVSNLCYALRDIYTEVVYRRSLQMIGKLLLGFYVVWLVWQLTLTANKVRKIGVWLIFAGVLTYYYNDMVKITIEYVHFIQYCALTLVVTKALNGRILIAMAICLLAGFLDEVYQTLAPISALNWRDVSLNVTGVVWGGLLWWTIKKNVV
ncbi:MAG: VanZ family protein [Methylococcaceae bacterium]|nr:VanZ family protein [Methylococcaceae bacterium]